MGLITKPFTYLPGAPNLIKSAEVNGNFDPIYNEFNGNITNANISASAAIAQSKIFNLIGDLAAKLSLTGGTITGPTVLRADQPYLRFTGTETAGKEFRIIEAAGLFVIQENTGTEASPSWTTRWQFRPAGAGEALDVPTKANTDFFYGSGLAAARIVYDDGDFTTSSGSYVEVNGLTLDATISALHRVRVSALVSGKTSIAASYVIIALQVDGVNPLGQHGFTRVGGHTMDGNLSFTFTTEPLTTGIHNFRLVAKATDGAEATVRSNADINAVLEVEELSR